MQDIDFRLRFKPSWTELACLFVGEFLIFWYAWLMEDAYVYFRYVDNLVIHGHGLVWNPGEYVEGFSSPLWVLLIIPLRALRLNYWLITRAAGMLFFFVFWWLVCLINRKLTVQKDSACYSWNLPLIYLSLNYGVLCYFTSGLETPFIHVMAAVYAASFLWPGSAALQILVGLSPFLRHELILPLVLYLAYLTKTEKRLPLPALAAFVISIGGYGLFRIIYYADLFPNTFYLKDITWFSQGLRYLYDTVLPYNTIPYFLVMFGLYLLARKSFGKTAVLTSRRVIILAAAIPTLVYVLKIGGDPRHFRYLAFPFILMVLATGGLFETAAGRLAAGHKPFFGLLMFAFAAAVFCHYPRQLTQHPFFRREFYYRHQTFMLINDAAFHRFFKGTTPKPWRSGQALSWKVAKERYTTEQQAAEVPSSFSAPHQLSKVMPVSYTTELAGFVAMEPLCRTAYLHPAIPVVHDLGLTEPVLARTHMHSERPAHKFGLQEMAVPLLEMRARYGFQKGSFDAAVRENPEIEPWLIENMDAIRKIQSKAYNTHHLLENMKLAFSRTSWIEPPAHLRKEEQ